MVGKILFPFISVLLLIGSVNAQSKQKDSFTTSFNCSLKSDGEVTEVKTDSEMRDYIEFELCNNSTIAITGVIFVYTPGYYPRKEAGRYKIRILPRQTGRPRFYFPLLNSDQYTTSNVHIGTVIYADGSRRNTIWNKRN
jgi:hypothetical protein